MMNINSWLTYHTYTHDLKLACQCIHIIHTYTRVCMCVWLIPCRDPTVFLSDYTKRAQSSSPCVELLSSCPRFPHTCDTGNHGAIQQKDNYEVLQLLQPYTFISH